MKLTEEKVIAKLQKLQEDDDFEVTHDEADELICKFLSSLGYKNVVKEWKKVGRYY